MSDLVNECTDEMTPLRVMKVPRMAKRKLMMTRDRFHTRSIFLRSSIMTECRNAVQVSHGMSEAFSTGSQAQYPPQPSSTYAHQPPRRIPVPRKNQEGMFRRRVVRNHVSSRRPVARAAMAKADGRVRPTYAR